AEFSQKLPEINLEDQVANTESIRQALINCSIDIASVEGKIDEPRIDAIHWQSDPLVVVASPAINTDKLSIDALNHHTWLVREPGSGTLETTLTLLAKHQISPQHRIQLGSNEAIAHAVVQG